MHLYTKGCNIQILLVVTNKVAFSCMYTKPPNVLI